MGEWGCERHICMRGIAEVSTPGQRRVQVAGADASHDWQCRRMAIATFFTPFSNPSLKPCDS